MTKSQEKRQLIHCVVCDDVRREDNGKFILVGVYPENILMNVVPAQLLVTVWLQLRLKIAKATTIEIMIKGDALEEPAPLSLDINDPNLFNKDESLPFIMKIALKIKRPGKFTISYKMSDEKDWNLAREMTVVSTQQSH